MKLAKSFFFVSLLFIAKIVLSQCNINFTHTVPGIYPDTMPEGYANNNYDEDITFVLLMDTQGIPFTNFEISSIVVLLAICLCASISNNVKKDCRPIVA